MSNDELRGLFSALLFRAAERHRVILLLDGLNLFERTDLARYLQWLPRELPPNCRVLATANAGHESSECERRGWHVTALDPLAEPAINGIFTDVCEQLYNRQGDRFEDLRAALMQKRDHAGRQAGGNPLWLRLALDLLNQLNEETYARQRTAAYRGLSPDARLNALLSGMVAEMPGDVEPLYGWLLERAEAAARHFGKLSDARLFACLIALTRSGLREKDLKALVSALSNEPWSDLRLAVLRRTFSVHLIQRGDLAQWHFFHAQMRAAVRQRYLADPNEEVHFHRSIALYLSGRLPGASPLPADDPLAEREMMHHWLQCGDEVEIARCCRSLLPGTQQAGTALGELVQDCCRPNRTEQEAQSWFRCLVDRLAQELEAGQLMELVAAHVIPHLKTFADRARRAGFSRLLWDVLGRVKPTLTAEKRVLHTVTFQTELAQALLAHGDLGNAAWHFRRNIQLVNEAAPEEGIAEPLLLAQCMACQAIAGILATPIVLQLYKEAGRYLDSACALAARHAKGSGRCASRWALLYTSLLIDCVSFVSDESKQQLLDQARQVATKIDIEPARKHALGVIALSQARHLKRIGENPEPEARASVSILKEVHAGFPSALEPLQHLIEARTNLFQIEYLRDYSPEIADEANAELSRLTTHLDRLSNGNQELHPVPFRVVDSLNHVYYWASIGEQLQKLIGEKDFERAEFLMELAWQALRNLARRGSWAPFGKSIEEHLAEVASHNLAIATFKHPGNPDPALLSLAMRRIVEAVTLSLAKNRPVEPGLYQVYEALLKAQPAFADRASLEGAALDNVSNASWLFEPPLRFDGTGWWGIR